MPKPDDGDVNYGEYSFKKYNWSENGREEKLRRTPPPKPIITPTKREKKMDKSGAIASVLIVLCFVITFLLTELVGNGELLTFLSNRASKSATYYAISMAQFDNGSVAAISADELRQNGAGGFVISDDGKYFLIASVYSSKSDAQKVKEKLASKDVSIYEIEIGLPSLKWCASGEMDSVLNALKYADTIYNQLYSISVSMDKGELADNYAREKIRLLLNNIETLIADFETKVDYRGHSEKTNIKAELAASIAMLDNLLNTSLARYSLVSDIRYTYTAVLMGYKNLIQNI